MLVPDKLLVATSNSSKLREIKELLAGANREVLFLSDLALTIAEPNEIGITFSENARLKARYYSQSTQLPTIADDSGLSVLELGGLPGVTSARWVLGSDQDRATALLQLLEEKGLQESNRRRAYFSCVVSLALPNVEQTTEFEGICWGTVAPAPRGTNGFGYDPIFIADGQTATMAELSRSEKNRLSARSLAFGKLATWLHTHSAGKL